MVSGEKDSTFEKFFVPTFDELTLFCMSYAVIVLLCISEEFRSEFSRFYLQDLGSIFILGMMIVGMIFSIYHVFSSREKKRFEKNFMLYFVVFVNLMVGGLGLLHFLHDLPIHKDFSVLLFPVWNIGYALYLYVLIDMKLLNHDSIRDENTPLYLTILSIIVLTVMLCVLQFSYQMYWIFIYSIALFYISIVTQIVSYMVKFAKKVKTNERVLKKQ